MAGRIIGYLTLVFIGIYLIFPTGVHAQTPIPSAVSPTSPVYTDLLVHNLFHSFSCLATGSSIIGQPCLTYQVTQNAQGAIQSIPVLSQTNLSGGALGATTSLIAALYMNPPVRTVDYLASLGESFGLVKEAKAQVVGSGQAVLNPILSLWTVSRNIAYLVMIIIFVVVGLMVMFRNRINPQTVITAQAALPGLVIGLILITFSYFFSALLTDTAFIGTNLVGAYFSAAQDPGKNPQNLVLELDNQHENVLSIFSRFAGIIRSDDITSALASIWKNLDNQDVISPQRVLTIFASLFISSFASQVTEGLKVIPLGVGESLQGAISLISAGITLAAPEPMIGRVLSIIAILILLYSMFKLLLRLINNYLSIIFLTVTAPFQFLAASLPGRQGIATGWAMSMLCNILVFPAVLAVFYFVAFILGKTYGPLEITTTQSVTGINTFPLFGSLNLVFIRVLLAYGALVASPAIPDIICRTIGRVSEAGQLLGQEFVGSTRGGYGYLGQAGQYAQGLGGATIPTFGKTGLTYTEGIGWQKSMNPLHGAQAGLAGRFGAFFKGTAKTPSG